MFPVGDLNIVLCGIASVAATMGYAFTRKQGPSSTPFTQSPTPTEQQVSVYIAEKQTEEKVSQSESSAQQPLRRNSLKRKQPDEGFDDREEDLGYPHNLTRIYPAKRSRTPSSRANNETHSSNEETKPSSVIPALKPVTFDAVVPSQPEVPQPPALAEAIAPVEPVVVAAATEAPRTPSPEPAPPTQATESAILPQTPPRSTTNAFASPFTRPATPAFGSFATPSFSSNSSQSSGFAAFAGSASPFASVKKTPQTSFRASLWSIDNQSGSPSEVPSFLGDSDAQNANELGLGSHALTALTPSQASKVDEITTGEENEDVEQEIRAVKLFVKRGNKPYTSGLVGHLKLLSDKKTLAERLLFRREPLWQVSMNVRVGPATRCVYDPEEHVIRLTLKEPVSAEKDTLELVVYALKPARGCSKDDFKDFAEALLKNGQFAKNE